MSAPRFDRLPLPPPPCPAQRRLLACLLVYLQLWLPLWLPLCLPLALSACAREQRPAAPASPAALSPIEWTFHPVDAPAEEPARAPEAAAAETDWKVDSPPGPTVEVPIDTDEGTWMNVDVSPDGKEIAFDLLGDLYTIPITGGQARSLTAGMAWDMQPRYSPDGRWIAFTSDRDGGDNIWVMPRQGGQARQVTKERFRLLNSPAWSPDGQFLAARKHFTGARSLGSGELWLYHLSGHLSSAQGLQMTDKPNDQQDVGEPAFSPDGRFVYFSQDITPGPFFQYNKDPHAGIYVIKRLDRTDGRVETLLSGPGGAVRPTPSPDGKRLAFVRRVGLRSVLLIHDLASGAERVVYDALDRDMQETWAIHGVYPTLAWTPDSASIVLWAGGKLRRVDAATGKAQDIPFHVKDTRTVSPALRTPVEVHPQRFHTRMLRWVQVAPDNRSVVFQALGHLYIRDLPDGKPRRLTRDDDVFEHWPAFSRDGRWIAYTTWNDESLGSVRVVSRRGGKGRVITPEPGHYVEPAFTPDGRGVVYRKVTADRLRSQRWSHDPGLYMVPAAGGEATLLARSGRRPHFGRGGDRLFFVDRDQAGDQARSVLASIGIDGKDRRVHLRSKNATGFRVSPDGQWVALRERFQAFVAPFPATGRPFDIGPESKALPVVRVSHDAGSFLHWSGDSTRLFWSLGPELYTRPLAEAFAFLDGAPAELPPPPERGIDIGMDVESYRPTGMLALEGARIVTMRGDQVIEDGVVLVDRDRIAAVGPRGQVEVPAAARRVDVRGMTIIPGLVDVHAHGPQGSHGIIPQQSWFHHATLAFGVTTAHDPSHDTDTIFAVSELARAGRIVAPRTFSTGTVLYGAETPIQARVDSLDDARAHLRRLRAVGAFSVKSYNQPRRDQRQQVIAAARELGMMVVPEGGSLLQHNLTMVVDGHTGIEHAVPIARGYRDIEQLWGATEVGYTPTMVVGYGGLFGENYWYAESDVFAHERLRRFVPGFVLEPASRRRLLASEGDWNHVAIARLCKQLLDAGVHIQIGAHGQREGLAAHWELWMLVQGGMTPHQALRAGTLHGAHYLGLDRDLGSIEPGKLADLAIIEGNPLEDIRNSERVRYTVLGGRMFDARTMNELAPGGRARPRAPYFWEREGGHAYQEEAMEAGAHGCGCPGGHGARHSNR